MKKNGVVLVLIILAIFLSLIFYFLKNDLPPIQAQTSPTECPVTPGFSSQQVAKIQQAISLILEVLNE